MLLCPLQICCLSGPQTSGNTQVFHQPCNDKQPCRLAKDGCFSMRVERASFRTCFHCVPVMEQGSCCGPHAVICVSLTEEPETWPVGGCCLEFTAPR